MGSLIFLLIEDFERNDFSKIRDALDPLEISLLEDATEYVEGMERVLREVKRAFEHWPDTSFEPIDWPERTEKQGEDRIEVNCRKELADTLAKMVPDLARQFRYSSKDAQIVLAEALESVEGINAIWQFIRHKRQTEKPKDTLERLTNHLEE